MTQVFEPDGDAVPVTVIDVVRLNIVVQIKTKDNDGYEAIQIGFGEKKRVNSPMKGHIKGLGQFQHLREFKVDDVGAWEVGAEGRCARSSKLGDMVDVSGTTKGHGFAGVVKRHGFHGGPKTHGQSDRHRAPGSIGSGTTPGQGLEGPAHGGPHGYRPGDGEEPAGRPRRTPKKGLLMVRGAVPGNEGVLLRIASHRDEGRQ